MTVVECDVPRHSALGKDLIERADFRDAYRAPLSRSDHSVVEIFFAIFAQRPGWMKLMLIARNKAATLAGLEVPTTSEIMNIKQRLKVTSAPIADFRPPPNRGQHTRASASRANPASRPSASPGGRKLRAEEQPAEQRRANDQNQSGDHLSTGSDNNR